MLQVGLLFLSLLVTGFRRRGCTAKSFARCRSIDLRCSCLLSLLAMSGELWPVSWQAGLMKIHDVVHRQTITLVLLLVTPNPSESTLCIPCTIQYMCLINNIRPNCVMYFIINKIQ